jgi:hypothetical protein
MYKYMKIKFFLFFLSICFGSNAQSYFISKLTPPSPNQNFRGERITLQGDAIVAYMANDSAYIDASGEEWENTNAEVMKYNAQGQLQWRKKLLPNGYLLPQINPNGLITTESDIYVGYSYLASEFVQPLRITQLSSEGVVFHEFTSSLNGRNEVFGDLYWYKNRLLSLSSRNITNTTSGVYLRQFSPDLTLLERDSFNVVSSSKNITNSFNSNLLANGKLLYFADRYNPNSFVFKTTVGSYDLTTSTDEIHSTTTLDNPGLHLLLSQQPNADSSLSIRSTITPNLTIQLCREIFDEQGNGVAFGCDNLPQLTFFGDGLYTNDGSYYLVGQIITDENPTPLSPRKGLIVKFNANNGELWRRFIVDTTYQSVLPASVTLNSCVFDTVHQRLFFIGTSVDPTSPTEQTSMILGDISPDGCLGANCNDTLYINNSPISTSAPCTAVLGLKIVPNPSTGFINIVPQNAETFVINRVEIRNIYGHVVFYKSGRNIASLDVSHLPNNAYIIRVTGENGQVIVSTFVKTGG